MKNRSRDKIPRLLEVAARHPLIVCLVGGVLLFCSFPPVGWGWLAWVALVPWLLLIETDQFRARHPWLKIWLAGLIFWAAEIYYISIPHWMLWIGWILFSIYLSVYPLLFVWLGRILVHDHRVPLVVAAPIVFTALEWIRAHMITGWGAVMLANSQFRYPRILQICDICGAYGLTFLMVTGSAGMLYLVTRQFRNWPGQLAGAAAILIVVVYGMSRFDQITNRCDSALQYPDQMDSNVVDILVVQGSIDTRFPATPDEMRECQRQMFREYLDLQRHWQSGRQNRRWPAVIIWPENKYPIPDILPGRDSGDDQLIREDFRRFHRLLYADVATPPAMIVGTTSFGDSDQIFNSALSLNPRGDVAGRYFKMHRVLFGEYVPFAQWFPFLDNMTPIGRGLTPGSHPVSFEINGFRYSPSICFESVQTHLIRDQVNELSARGEEPDVLVNITDDGWFYGTAALDHHLACNVIRAVENRKPVIVAANTGISALIDSGGRILVEAPRRKTQLLEMKVPLIRETSPYRSVGDWPAIVLTAICVLAIILRRQGRGWKQNHPD